MRNWLGILFFLLYTSLFAQVNVTPKADGSVPDAVTAFGVNIASGQKIYNKATGQLFVCNTPTLSTATLTSASSNFRDLGDYNQLENKPTIPGGTVTGVSVATANGVSGSSSGGATPALTLTLGAITPSTVNGLTHTPLTTGYSIAGGTTPATLTVDQTASISSLAPIYAPAFTGIPTGIGLPVYVSVYGSDVTTTGQTLVAITGLSVALSSSATYEFEAVLGVSTSAVTTGCEYGVNGPSGSTITAVISGSYTTTASVMARITAANTPTGALLTTSAQSGGVIIKGTIAIKSTAGNITIQHLKVTSGTSTVFAGSSLKVTRID